MKPASPYAPIFDDWTWLSRAQHLFQRLLGHIKWGVFNRSKRRVRKAHQALVIHEINRFFNIGWQLFGHGPVPWCGIQWSDAWANTIFSFAARDDFSRSGYHYRVDDEEVDGEMGIYCLSTDEDFKLHKSAEQDNNTYLTIAAASVGLIVDGDEWTPERMQVIKDRIAAAAGLVEVEA